MIGPAERTRTYSKKKGPVKKRFGVPRATTLLHFVSGGRFPIIDSRVRRAIVKLLATTMFRPTLFAGIGLDSAHSSRNSPLSAETAGSFAHIGQGTHELRFAEIASFSETDRLPTPARSSRFSFFRPLTRRLACCCLYPRQFWGRNRLTQTSTVASNPDPPDAQRASVTARSGLLGWCVCSEATAHHGKRREAGTADAPAPCGGVVRRAVHSVAARSADRLDGPERFDRGSFRIT